MRLALLALLAAVSSAAASSSLRGPAPTLRADTTAEARHRVAQLVLDSLGPRAALPADSVWTGLKVLNGLKAGQLVRIMDQGFGRSLGVGCSFCHVAGQFDRDDSVTKEIARQMWRMQGRINRELLGSIPNLKGPDPVINCTTCHRGQVKPALNLEGDGTN